MIAVVCVLIDGKKIAAEIESRVRDIIIQKNLSPSLVFFVVGNDPATGIYVRKKQEACQRIGIRSEGITLPSCISESELVEKICAKNNTDATGIIVQLPLPDHIRQEKVAAVISPPKDVDCQHPENIGRLVYSSTLMPCTVAGVMELIGRSGVEVKGRNVVIINRNYIGKTLALLLAGKKASVSLCGKNTDLEKFTKEADIIVTAAGSPGLLKMNMLKKGVVVIDVGITRVGGKIIGDAADDVKEIASFLTPVPGGVGPMTVAMLMKNALTLELNRFGKRMNDY